MMSFTSRSCRPEVFCKKGILSNFLGVLRNHLYQSLFLTKLQACNFIKKETLAQVFYCEFCETFKSNYFYRTPLDDCFWNFKIQFLRRIKWFIYRLKKEWTLTRFIVFVHKGTLMQIRKSPYIFVFM